jgi:hypothetical protein
VLNNTELLQPPESSCNRALKTVTVKLQVEVLPEASVAVQLTVVTPTGKQLPEGGLQMIVVPGQLSVVVAVKVTTLQASLTVAVTAVWFAGQAITGGSMSLTVTVNEQLAVRLLASVAVQLTVVTPFGKAVPEGGVQTTPTPGQLSLAVAAKVTTAEQELASVLRTMFTGQAMVGFWVSLTVMVKLQLDWLFELSATVQFTVVVPFANAEPDGGVQIGVKPLPPAICCFFFDGVLALFAVVQLSVTVGAG